MCISSPETNSWSVIYRKNSGEDINITSLTFKNSLLLALQICRGANRACQSRIFENLYKLPDC